MAIAPRTREATRKAQKAEAGSRDGSQADANGKTIAWNPVIVEGQAPASGSHPPTKAGAPAAIPIPQLRYRARAPRTDRSARTRTCSRMAFPSLSFAMTATSTGTSPRRTRLCANGSRSGPRILGQAVSRDEATEQRHYQNREGRTMEIGDRGGAQAPLQSYKGDQTRSSSDRRM